MRGFLIFALPLALFHFSGSRPTDLGVKDGRLAPCPSSPNCVSSQAQDQDHRVAPINYQGSRDAAMGRLLNLVKSQPRVQIIAQKPDYLYVEYETAFLGFVDDVEFYLPSDANRIEVRSASRLGHSDFGVNRKRIEALRAQFEAMP